MNFLGRGLLRTTSSLYNLNSKSFWLTFTVRSWLIRKKLCSYRILILKNIVLYKIYKIMDMSRWASFYAGQLVCMEYWEPVGWFNRPTIQGGHFKCLVSKVPRSFLVCQICLTIQIDPLYFQENVNWFVKFYSITDCTVTISAIGR